MQTRRRTILFIAMISAAVVMLSPYLIPLPAMVMKDPDTLARPGGRFITINGVRTYFEEAGPPGGPAVVLIHGMGGSTFSWRHTLPALAEKGFHAVAIDQTGLGLSDKEGVADYSHPAYVKTIVRIMDNLGIPRAAVVGHSMGANVAAHLALSHPDRVEKLVIVDGYFIQKRLVVSRVTAPMLRFPPFQRWARLALRTFLRPDNVSRILRSAYADPALVTQEVVDGYARPLHTAGWDESVLGIFRDLSRGVLPSPLSSIKAPTLVIWGENDRWVPLRKGKEFQQQFTGAEFVVIPRAGHMVAEERPEALNERLFSFLER